MFRHSGLNQERLNDKDKDHPPKPLQKNKPGDLEEQLKRHYCI